MTTPREEYVYLRLRKDKLEEQLITVNKNLRTLEPQVLKEFERENVNKLLTEDGGLIYLRRDFYVGRAAPTVTPEIICRQLWREGLGRFTQTRPNYEELSKFVKQLDDDDQAFFAEYPALNEYLKVSEVFRICYKSPKEAKEAQEEDV